jgi:hypothetical protein
VKNEEEQEGQNPSVLLPTASPPIHAEVLIEMPLR